MREMAVVVNPYSHQQLGLIEAGLKTLKNDKGLMSYSEFSDMYWAVEKHHRDLRLAHLTGKAKDLMEQADKDTQFYNILINMLCEVKKLPSKKRKNSLHKVHHWYMGNRHTLATGPRFGKSKMEAGEVLKADNKLGTKPGKFSYRSSKSTSSISHKRSNKENEDIKRLCETRDDVSSMHGIGDSMNPPSEPASSRLSVFGNDFLTNRFMMDLPMNKLSWHPDTPLGKSASEMISSPIDWDGPDLELQHIGESSLSRPIFDEQDHPSHLSVPNSSPQSHVDDASPHSVDSGGSEGNVSSRVDVGSTDMMDFHSDVRRRLSHGINTSTGSRMQGMTDDQSSIYGLPRKMVHSIASLVNPHAKLAESEAKKMEAEYNRAHTPATPFKASSRVSSSKGAVDLSAHIPVLHAVSVSSNKGDLNMKAFSSFRQDHLYGQDILSKLNFVGRSGTALDVRYSAHAQGDQPEHHTKNVVQLYSMSASDGLNPHVKQTESKIHNQTLEEFYKAADDYCLTPLTKYHSARTQSAPAPRIKSSKMRQTKTAQPKDRHSPTKFQTTQKLGKSLLENKQEDDEDEILYSSVVERPQSAVKLEVVVNMIDQVKDEMNFFREKVDIQDAEHQDKLAPAPMPGFRQPASVSVSGRPLSRPASTTSHRSRPLSSQVRPRSPSPQGRPNSPQEADEILMGEPEVPFDTFRTTLPLRRPHSATVSKAVDWRGKISPESARIRSKTRFGGHSYVQKLKPSLRTAGACSAGKRPKTAPISMKGRWNSKDKEDSGSVMLPKVKIQECDKNERVSAQAASNTMTQVEDQDMDRIMSIQHLLGSSDSRYGSMGSLFLDEDFLRSMNSRYATVSSLGSTQNKEYLSFVAPKTPRHAATESRQGIRKTDINQIAEELSDQGDDNQYVDATDDVPSLQLGEQGNGSLIPHEPDTPQGSLFTAGVDSALLESDAKVTGDTENISQSQINISEDQLKSEGVSDIRFTEESSRSEGITREVPSRTEGIAREVVHFESEGHDDDIHIEVTAIPAIGVPRTPPTNAALQGLSESETWHFQPQNNQNCETVVSGAADKIDLEPRLQSQTQFRHQHHHAHHRHDIESQHGDWAKSIVKQENYCFLCLPTSMSTKVGRSAGRMPGRVQSPAGQVLRMARRQNEHFKKAPPVRTPPSIPSTHHMHCGSSPRQGQQYSTELEHHARKVKSPRHFLEQESPRRSRPVVELRKENCRSAPPGFRQDVDDITGSLSIVSLRSASRSQTAPTLNTQRTSDTLGTLPTHHEECDQFDEGSTCTETPEVTHARTSATRPIANQQSLAHIGRPIPQISHVPDPDEVAEAVMKQREATAAVDIQRIFRGYVCRNSYRKLLWENRKDMEDKQLALQESQREYRKHQDRKAKIYNRPPLDPELLKWAKDFKQIQSQHKEERQVKVDSVAQEILTNHQKAKSKIEVIGPHVEIYDIYHPKDTGPSKREMHTAAVHMQKHVRGFLVRRRFEKLRRKATFCGSTWDKIVKDYKNLLTRVQRWHGVAKPSTPFSIQEINEYMDLRRRYESQFDKKAFGSELELSELESFFHECDLYPSGAEIEDGLDVTTQGQSLKKGNGLRKHEAMNLLFYIYVPPATGLTDTRQSTWMNPIIHGVEAKKFIGSEFIEMAPLKPCADLVIKSRKERNMKENQEKERLQELERKACGDNFEVESDSDGNSQVSASGKRLTEKKRSMNNKLSSGTKGGRGHKKKK